MTFKLVIVFETRKSTGYFKVVRMPIQSPLLFPKPPTTLYVFFPSNVKPLHDAVVICSTLLVRLPHTLVRALDFFHSITALKTRVAVSKRRAKVSRQYGT